MTQNLYGCIINISSVYAEKIQDYTFRKVMIIMKTFMRFPQGKPKALTFSYDDGVISDRKLIGILDKYNLKCTFNINSGLFASEEFAKANFDNPTRRMTAKEAYDTYMNSGHEVAAHGLTHSFMEQLPGAMAAYETLEDRLNLEKMFKTIVRGMAYPFGTHSDKVVEALANSGIVYSRTVITTGKFDIPTDWLRLSATCHHKNPRLDELADAFIGELPNTANQKPRLFYVWGHSYEFVNDDNWDVIENFAAKVSNKEDVWYATNIEIYDYIQAYNSLIFSADGSFVSNPTATELWFTISEASNDFIYKDELICVKPGETKKIR